MGDTEISWTHRPGTRGRTWNPTQGCSRVSEGCRNCYAERMAARFADDGWSQGLINLKTRKWNGTVRLAAHKLADPLKWRAPSTVFVNSMSDLFHEELTNEEIAAVFGVMAAAPQHLFQCLTKRPKRMREWFEWVTENRGRTPYVAHDETSVCIRAAEDLVGMPLGANCEWPLQNVWLGTSCENQDAADERIPELLKTPAAVRFLSCEPLLGPLALAKYLGRMHRRQGDFGVEVVRLPEQIGWVIGGCESGPGARPCDVAWLRSLRNQCAADGVPYFLKQAVGTVHDNPESRGLGAVEAGDRSKRKAGGVIELPYLDGEQHAEFPA